MQDAVSVVSVLRRGSTGPKPHSPASPFAKPFLKWAGGKANLLPQLEPLLPSEVTDYVEPFVGGGAMFFHLRATGRAKDAVLADVNADLIACYRAIKDNVDQVLAALGQLSDTSPEAYYAAREVWNDRNGESTAERAALFLYLSHNCFNGLWRVNADGRMNTPVGSSKKDPLPSEEKLRSAAAALDGVVLADASWEKILGAHASKDTYCFLDPPYLGTYDGYSSQGFDECAHELLAEGCRWLDDVGARFMLTHADHQTIRELYRGFDVREVEARRSVSGKASGRGSVKEIVVRNYGGTR